jgi:riboflavin synthase
MFTGIVQGAFPVVAVDRHPHLLRYAVGLPASLRRDLRAGASVSIDGVCQTVTRIEGEAVGFDAVAETLRVSTLGELRAGSRVHVERSARAGEEIGGHVVSGHVDATCRIAAVDAGEDHRVLTLEPPSELLRYLFTKGFVALHGCSLTACDVDEDAATFRVHLIPETLRLTTFGEKRVGDRVNLEVDRQTQVLVDTIERTMTRVLARRG